MNTLTRIGLASALCVALTASFSILAGGKKERTKPLSIQDTSKTEIGKAAPDFTLRDTKGNEYALSDYKDKLVILEWTNPECPYVVGNYKSKAIQDTYAAIKELDEEAVWFSINTTHHTKIEDNEKWIEEYELEYPILLDRDGKVGKLYGAKTTPHFYIIDGEGILRYQGAFSNNPRGRKNPDEIINYVLQAVNQIHNGEDVKPDFVKPWGCSVKYAKK